MQGSMISALLLIPAILLATAIHLRHEAGSMLRDHYTTAKTSTSISTCMMNTPT
jgi:hypothetical protein